MKLKIYYGDKPLYLCDEMDSELDELSRHPDAVYVDELSTPAINAMMHEIRKEEFHAGIFFSEDFEKLKKSFFRHFTVIEAAGGIVQNDSRDILFIFRRGKWDLPKGKMEKGESAADCASREITEETGVDGLILKKEVGSTYHLYDEFGKHFLKVSHWFYFTCPDGQTGTPQAEEDITEIKWFATKEIRKPMQNTFATIKDILSVFFDSP